MKTEDQRILQELKGYLLNATEWAADDDILENDDGWSCIKSTMKAVEEGNVGLALTRWDDLCSPNRPVLSEAAQNWRAT